ncbi:hypothetical protein BDQ12DRAFT_701132 [Crucibulum laeve]|uniref:Uncharacterized protein n=1 Tax=Crucibulum laeve TaxID=68775 RepID=A0A5C3LKX0_9AGAR|nr:hypothetical protein BDQ12DRAFT_701132 [Crucibulum laeve]
MSHRRTTTTTPVFSELLPRAEESHIPKPRKPKSGTFLLLSPLRPHVLAREHIQMWTSPHAINYKVLLRYHFSTTTSLTLFSVLLNSLESKTCENYGAGLLRFHQFCDSENITESDRMPAPESLLAAFFSRSTMNSWLAGIHFWHTFNGASWLGGDVLNATKKGLSKMVPSLSTKQPRPPVTLHYMNILLHGLDLSNAFDAAVWAVASISFWSCCRYAPTILI